MFKFVSTTLFAIVLVLASTENYSTTLAGTCASKCGLQPIQFTPGQRIQVKIVNRTSILVKFEKIQGTDPIFLHPGQELTLSQGDGTKPNVSLVFWDDIKLSLKAIVSKPNFGTLQVELRPNWRSPGDRSVYVRDDGRVNVL
ncbi:MAG: hypothetical protein PUP93_04800 [Rhizonema sp. NSF051]|nr:hypothetical protein [Rhizonema sp. NSF051]